MLDAQQKLELLQAAKVLQTYLNHSTQTQDIIRELVSVLNDPKLTEDDCDTTLITLADLIFPKQ